MKTQFDAILEAACDNMDNDPRLPVILIMRGARRTWREIGRKLRIAPSTAMRIYRRRIAEP